MCSDLLYISIFYKKQIDNMTLCGLLGVIESSKFIVIVQLYN